MVYKRYKSPFEEKPCNPQKEQDFVKPSHGAEKCEKPQKPQNHQGQNPVSLGFFENLSNDDIILIGLIIILLAENKESRDVPLILTLGFLFLIQFIDAD